MQTTTFLHSLWVYAQASQVLSLPFLSEPLCVVVCPWCQPWVASYSHCNNLETCKDSCKRTIKGEKGQLKQMESKTHLVQSKRTATRAAVLTIAMQRPQRSHVTRLLQPVCNAAQRDSPHTAMHLIIATSGPRSHLIYYVFDPLLIHWKKLKNCPTTVQSRWTTCQAPPSPILLLPKWTPQPTRTPLLTKAWTAL